MGSMAVHVACRTVRGVARQDHYRDPGLGRVHCGTPDLGESHGNTGKGSLSWRRRTPGVSPPGAGRPDGIGSIDGRVKTAGFDGTSCEFDGLASGVDGLGSSSGGVVFRYAKAPPSGGLSSSFVDTGIGTGAAGAAVGTPYLASPPSSPPAHTVLHSSTLLVVPIRAELDAVKRLMKGDTYVGRGCKQRGLAGSSFGNHFKVSAHGRARAVAMFRQHLDKSPD